MDRGTVLRVGIAVATNVGLAGLLAATMAGAATLQDPTPGLSPAALSTAAPTPFPIATLPVASAQSDASASTPTPSSTATPTSTPISTPVSTPTPMLPEVPGPPELEIVDLIGPPSPVEGPPSPLASSEDQPVAHVEAEVVVTDDRAKKPKKRKEEKLAGKVDDKKWLSEVCPIDEKSGSWLDRSQERLGWSVCRATLWFDGLFGDERAILERDATYGYIEPRIQWSEHDGIDPKLRFRGKINLPVADRRFNALLGRSENDEEGRRSRDIGGGQLPTSFRDADEEWLVGLGYSPVRGSAKRFDFDAGVKVNTPLDFFGQGRYRRHWFLSERDLVRLRQTVFWRTDDGFGTTTNLDFERVLRGTYVVRWRNGATWADNSRGVDWFQEWTLFHRLGEKAALAYVLGVDGATDAEVPVRKYGLEVVYRRNILREWLFVEVRPGVDWRRRQDELERKIEPILDVGIQIHFGDRDFE